MADDRQMSTRLFAYLRQLLLQDFDNDYVLSELNTIILSVDANAHGRGAAELAWKVKEVLDAQDEDGMGMASIAMIMPVIRPHLVEIIDE